MDWRFIVAAFVLGVGFIVGWVEFGTFIGAFLSAVFASGLFVVHWMIDQQVYDL